MKLSLPLLTTMMALLCGCSSGASRRTPELSSPISSNENGPHQDIFQQAGDDTWRVLTAPAHLIPQNKPAAAREPEVYEAPEVIISPRGGGDGSTPAP